MNFRKLITILIGFAAIVTAYYSIEYFLEGHWNNMAEFRDHNFGPKILLAWIFGPPLWFFCERYVLWFGTNESERVGLKEGRDLAKPLWAAVLATLLLLVK